MTRPRKRRRARHALTPTPHDAVFKLVFSDPAEAAPLLARLVPTALSVAADWSTLRLVPGTQVERRLVERRTDLVFAVHVGGSDVAIVLVFEHQSTVDPWFGLRALRYGLGHWEQHRKSRPTMPLPPVVTVVLSHAVGGWTASRHLADLVDFGALRDPLEALVPGFEYLVLDVARLTDAEVARVAMGSLARGLLLLFRDGRTHRVSALLRRHASVFDAIARGAKLEAVEGLLRYALSQADEAEHREVLEVVATLGGEKGERNMRSVADKLFQDGYAKGIEKGLEKGIEKGLERGRIDGQRELVRRAVEKRFGALAPTHAVALSAADAQTLERWIDRLFTASSPDDLFGHGS